MVFYDVNRCHFSSECNFLSLNTDPFCRGDLAGNLLFNSVECLQGNLLSHSG